MERVQADMTLRADGRRNRALILATARDLVAETGDVTLSEVSRRSGLTRATVYRHFDDREALLDAVARDLAATMLPELFRSMESVPFDEAWQVLASVVTEAAVEHADLIRRIGPTLEAAARAAVHDEPVGAYLARRRQAGDFESESSDGWLAECVRALCLAAVARTDGTQEKKAEDLYRALVAVIR